MFSASAFSQVSNNKTVTVCMGAINTLAHGLCMLVGTCACGLHVSIQTCVRNIMVPPGENRWSFLSVLLHTLPLTLQGGSITARNKHPFFGRKAQEMHVYCCWGCLSHWFVWGWDKPKPGMWA